MRRSFDLFPHDPLLTLTGEHLLPLSREAGGRQR
jgi:hypothetical protein